MVRSFHLSFFLKAAAPLLVGTALVACGTESGDSGGDESGTGATTSTGSATGTGSSTGTGAEAGTGGGTATGGATGTGGTSGTGAEAGTGSATGTGGGSPTEEPFSFFVTSLAAMQELSGSEIGFGGDLSFGQTGPGAGLRGADAICTAIAEKSMPGNGKTWRAFLSATDGGDGTAVNAIDRVGEGPWYDRLGRLVANNKADLQNDRPAGDAEIINDLPNEDGVPNHNPDGTEVDNHDTLTGSNAMGELASQDAADTCNDWTSAVGEAGVNLQIGHSWPRSGGGGGGVQSWIAEHNAGGCAPGVNLFGQGGPQQGDYTVGAGGGYGGIYCFALTP